MRKRLLVVFLVVSSLLISTVACANSKELAPTPTPTPTATPKPTLSEREVIANVQMKGIPKLMPEEAREYLWSAKYLGNGEWAVTAMNRPYSVPPWRIYTWYYYEKTGAVSAATVE